MFLERVGDTQRQGFRRPSTNSELVDKEQLVEEWVHHQTRSCKGRPLDLMMVECREDPQGLVAKVGSFLVVWSS